MKKTIIIVSIITFFILFIWFYISVGNFEPKGEKELIEKIERLEHKLDSLNNRKDSIRSVIDSTHVKIITNEKRYQERINTIITQPDSFSESFTRQYLRDYASTRGYCIIGTSEIE